MKKIGFKFASAIIVLALISIISLGFMANSMTTITESSQDVMNNEVEKINLIHSIYEDYLDMYMNLYAHVDTKLVRTMDRRASDVLERRALMWESMAAYEEMITSEEVQESFNALRNRLESFDAYADNIMELSRENDKERASTLISNNLGSLNRVLDQAMSTMLEYSEEDLENAKADQQTKANNSYTLTVVVIVLLSSLISTTLFII